MDWILIGGAMLAVWAAASVVGNERQRRLDALATPTSDPAATPATADPADSPPNQPSHA